jgi:hypothetical protein
MFLCARARVKMMNFGLDGERGVRIAMVVWLGRHAGWNIADEQRFESTQSVAQVKTFSE